MRLLITRECNIHLYCHVKKKTFQRKSKVSLNPLKYNELILQIQDIATKTKDDEINIVQPIRNIAPKL